MMSEGKRIYDLAKNNPAVMSHLDNREKVVLWYSFEDINNSLEAIAQRLQELGLLQKSLCAPVERVRQIREKALIIISRHLKN